MGRRSLAFGLVAGVLVISGGVAFGLNTYARKTICGGLDGGGGSSSAAAGGSDAVAQFEDAAGEMHTYARLLFFDPDLRRATDGLAADLDQMAVLARKAGGVTDPDATELTSIVALATSVNSHAMAAQRACGLPAKGIFTD